MTVEFVFAGETPTNDDADPGLAHAFGMRVQVSADLVVQPSGCQVWCPSVKPPTIGWGLYHVTTSTLMQTVDMSALTLTAGAWNDVPGVSAHNLINGHEYIPYAYYNLGRIAYSTTGVTFPLTHSAHMSASTGVFRNGGTLTDAPTTDFALYGFAQLAAAVPPTLVHGSGTADLGPLTATGTGHRTVHGVGLADLGALVAAATGHRSVHGAGLADLGALVALGLGHRTVHGAGLANLAGLVSAATGHRTVHGVGSADLGPLTATGLVQSNVTPGVLTAAEAVAATLAAGGTTVGLIASGTP